VDNKTEQLQSATAEVLQRGEEERLTEEYFGVPSLQIVHYAAVQNIQSIREHRNLIHSLYVLTPIGASRVRVAKF
jgi:hypothetical protein